MPASDWRWSATTAAGRHANPALERLIGPIAPGEPCPLLDAAPCGPAEYERQVAGPDGEPRWLAVTVADAPAHLVVSAHDITGRRAAEDRRRGLGHFTCVLPEHVRAGLSSSRQHARRRRGRDQRAARGPDQARLTARRAGRRSTSASCPTTRARCSTPSPRCRTSPTASWPSEPSTRAPRATARSSSTCRWRSSPGAWIERGRHVHQPADRGDPRLPRG